MVLHSISTVQETVFAVGCFLVEAVGSVFFAVVVFAVVLPTAAVAADLAAVVVAFSVVEAASFEVLSVEFSSLPVSLTAVVVTEETEVDGARVSTVTPHPEKTSISTARKIKLNLLILCSEKFIFFRNPFKSFADIRRKKRKRDKGSGGVNKIEADARRVNRENRLDVRGPCKK